MLNELINLANHLDQKGLKKEADALDSIIKSAATSSGANLGEEYYGIQGLIYHDILAGTAPRATDIIGRLGLDKSKIATALENLAYGKWSDDIIQAAKDSKIR